MGDGLVEGDRGLGDRGNGTLVVGLDLQDGLAFVDAGYVQADCLALGIPCGEGVLVVPAVSGDAVDDALGLGGEPGLAVELVVGAGGHDHVDAAEAVAHVGVSVGQERTRSDVGRHGLGAGAVDLLLCSHHDLAVLDRVAVGRIFLVEGGPGAHVAGDGASCGRSVRQVDAVQVLVLDGPVLVAECGEAVTVAGHDGVGLVARVTLGVVELLGLRVVGARQEAGR